jgi:polar amino acid transport system substrate-binding protein
LIKIILLSFLLFSLTISSTEVKDKPRELTLATTKWCPYTCFDKNKKYGVVGTYIRKIISSYGIELTINSYPWSRAIRLVESKNVDGLLTATPAEAPTLLFTEFPIDSYQMCFYTLSENQWTFNQPISFGSNLLAVVQDYGYGEPLDTYIKNNSLITTISGEDVSTRLISLLLNKRVDVIVADKLVVEYKMANNLISTDTIRQAGCLMENYFYLALSSTTENKNLLTKISADLIKPENINLYNSLKLKVSKSH